MFLLMDKLSFVKIHFFIFVIYCHFDNDVQLIMFYFVKFSYYPVMFMK